MRFSTLRRVRTRAVATAIILGAIAAGSATSASAQTKVRYSEVLRSIFYLPSYVALKNGYFTEQGIDVDLSTAWGSDKGTPQLMAGTVDIALLGPEVAIYIENSPSPVKSKIFCALTAKDGLILMSRQKIAPAEFNWNMLKGKTLLSWRSGNTPYVDTEWVLKKHGIDSTKDMEDISNVASGNRDAAWLGGKGDFGTFFEPTASLLEREGKAYPVASIGEEIGAVDFTAFLATDTYIAKNPKAVQGWCNAIHKAQKFVAGSTPEELATIVAPYFPQLAHELIVSSIKRYRDLGIWKTDPTTEPDAIVKMQDVMIAGGMLKADQRVPYEKVVTRTFAETAKQSVK